jgi:hypothetical protein
MTPLTNARFTRSIAGLTRHCACWATDTLDLEPNEPAGVETILAFVRGARLRLDLLESVARETAPPTCPLPRRR